MAAAAAGTPEPTKVLGKGGFGVVFTPAMNNINATGTRKSFPGHVTKVFFKEEAYKKALRDAEELKKKVPALAIPYAPYEHPYKLKEIPASVIATLTRDDVGGVKRGDPAHMLHMPNLGVSIHDFLKSLPLRTTYQRSVPFEKTVQELYKLMTIVKAIGEAGLIHADIRETNVLVNPDTGDMTIIDFDLLSPKESMSRKLRPFYNRPPELLYMSGFISKLFLSIYLGSNQRYDPTLELPRASDMYQLEDVYKPYWPAFLEPLDDMLDESVKQYNRVLDTITDTFERYSNAERKEELNQLTAKTADTVDSYGLAYTLALFCMGIFSSGPSEHATMYKFFFRDDGGRLRRMMHGDFEKRMTIEKMMDDYKAYIAEKFPQIRLPPDSPATAVAVVAAEAERLAELGGATGGVGAIPVRAPSSNRMLSSTRRRSRNNSARSRRSQSKNSRFQIGNE